MAVLEVAKSKFVDKTWLRKTVEEQNAVTGFTPVPGATAQMAREMIAEDLRKSGVVAEDRIFSQGIVAMREE